MTDKLSDEKLKEIREGLEGVAGFAWRFATEETVQRTISTQETTHEASN